jgi:hypothetical protein
MNEGWKSALSQDFMHWDRAVAVSHCDCRSYFFSSPQWGRTQLCTNRWSDKTRCNASTLWQTDSVVADKHSNAALTHCFALPPWLAWTSLAGLSAVNGCSTWPTPPAFSLRPFNFHCYLIPISKTWLQLELLKYVVFQQSMQLFVWLISNFSIKSNT